MNLKKIEILADNYDAINKDISTIKEIKEKEAIKTISFMGISVALFAPLVTAMVTNPSLVQQSINSVPNSVVNGDILTSSITVGVMALGASLIATTYKSMKSLFDTLDSAQKQKELIQESKNVRTQLKKFGYSIGESGLYKRTFYDGTKIEEPIKKMREQALKNYNIEGYKL